jgi:glycosyltransferase involved in cell wall biosynthesis
VPSAVPVGVPSFGYHIAMSRIALIGGFGDLVVKLRGPLVRALRSAGHEVVVCVPAPSEEARAGVESGLRELGARLVVAPLDRTGTNLISELTARNFYAEFMKAERPDAVLAYNPKPIFYAVTAARRAGVPRVAAMVTGLGYAFTSRDVKAKALALVAMRLYRRAFAAADCVMFQNPDDLGLFGRLGLLGAARDARVVPGSGVDLERFQQVPILEPPSRVDFLFAGRLLRDKGLGEFVEAARALRALRTDAARFRFQLAGFTDGNPSSATAAEIDGWSRAGIVEHLGRLEDVRPALAACSVFVIPSFREGLPMAALEAMATGRAVVAGDVAGCRSVVEDGVNGLLVPPGSAPALAVAMEQFLEDPSLVVSMGRASRERAERLFDSRSVCRQVVDSLLGR